jgi:hypothetical protein
LLLDAIRRTGDLKMPPDGPLPAEEIAALEWWVGAGLPWPAEASAAPATMEERIAAARREHWALQPVRAVAPPTVATAERLRTPVDAFVLAPLEAAGLTLSDEADRRSLLRRVTLDLIGLPPSFEDVQAFEQDDAPDAYERAVERLLASPRYGERWGRHWLDVARYADTKGYVFTEDRRYPYAYTYRDYVVRSFNEDLPYDRFLIEQIAADRLDDRTDARSLAALGFLTVGRRFDNDVHAIVDDRIDVVTRGLMGLTVGCARCHDHKFDPVPTADYYALYGVFMASREPKEGPLIAKPEEVAGAEAFNQELAKRQAELDAETQRVHAEVKARLRRGAEVHFLSWVRKRGQGIDGPGVSADPTPAADRRWRQTLGERFKAEDAIFGAWVRLEGLPNDEFAAQAAEKLTAWSRGEDGGAGLNARVLRALTEAAPKSTADVARAYAALLVKIDDEWSALLTNTAGGENRPAPTALPDAADEQLRQLLFAEGAPANPTPEETKGLIDRAQRQRLRDGQKKIDAFKASSPDAPARAMALEDVENPGDARILIRGNPGRPGEVAPRRFLQALSGDAPTPLVNGSGRLELARAIADESNPLTARVFVNRVWALHFGRGLAASPADFGVRSERPVHAELLDWLAADFMASGWSVKQLHRRIVLSAAYRQSSGRRSECEEVDPTNRLWHRAERRRLEFEPLRDSLLHVAGMLYEQQGGRAVPMFTESGRNRRTIYGVVDRQDLPGLLRVFDFASPDVSTAERPRTMSPQQALYLMNGTLAQSLSERLATGAAGEPEALVAGLYRRILARGPTEREQQLARAFLAEAGASGPASLAQALLMCNEFIYVD